MPTRAGCAPEVLRYIGSSGEPRAKSDGPSGVKVGVHT